MTRVEIVDLIASALPTPYYSRKPHATPDEIAHERAEDVMKALEGAGIIVDLGHARRRWHLPRRPAA